MSLCSGPIAGGEATSLPCSPFQGLLPEPTSSLTNGSRFVWHLLHSPSLCSFFSASWIALPSVSHCSNPLPLPALVAALHSLLVVYHSYLFTPTPCRVAVSLYRRRWCYRMLPLRGWPRRMASCLVPLAFMGKYVENTWGL